MKCSEINIRDPFIVQKDGIYYMYGTRAVRFGNRTGGFDVYTSSDLETWSDPIPCFDSEKYGLNRAVNWAPEVHEYKGAYYMIATYYWEKTGHRGCSILKADSPAGPFVQITNGHITPWDWDAIDGTLYVDKEGQPWMVFVHEWTCTDDGVGRMCVAKLSEDLSHFVSEPKELFRATDPSWTDIIVTDGCFMYTTKNGTLLMIWSNGSPEGYCVGIARSKSGNVEGPWEQDDERLFYRKTPDSYDGGHAMIFTHTDGQMYLALHGPNRPAEGETTKVMFFPIEEKNDTLVIVE